MRARLYSEPGARSADNAGRAAGAAGQHFESDSPQGAELWGPDLLSHSALGAGDKMKVDVAEAGLWDVRALDRDNRYQHVTGLRLAAGGRYILELNNGGWRVK